MARSKKRVAIEVTSSLKVLRDYFLVHVGHFHVFSLCRSGCISSEMSSVNEVVDLQ